MKILETTKLPSRHNKAKCICDCGNIFFARLDNIKSGVTRSCGCLRFPIHGHTKKRGRETTKTYNSWRCMKRRCYYRRDVSFSHYGGRGIQVCARWFDFRNFLNDMGERPAGMTLDRIDPNGHYMPSNCRWATPSQQVKNRRQKAPVAEWTRHLFKRKGKQ